MEQKPSLTQTSPNFVIPPSVDPLTDFINNIHKEIYQAIGVTPRMARQAKAEPIIHPKKEQSQ